MGLSINFDLAPEQYKEMSGKRGITFNVVGWIFFSDGKSNFFETQDYVPIFLAEAAASIKELESRRTSYASLMDGPAIVRFIPNGQNEVLVDCYRPLGGNRTKPGELIFPRKQAMRSTLLANLRSIIGRFLRELTHHVAGAEKDPLIREHFSGLGH